MSGSSSTINIFSGIQFSDSCDPLADLGGGCMFRGSRRLGRETSGGRRGELALLQCTPRSCAEARLTMAVRTIKGDHGSLNLFSSAAAVRATARVRDFFA